jgi:UPF0755 protein
MTRRRAWAAVALLCSVALVGSAGVWLRSALYADHTRPGARPVLVQVPPGTTLRGAGVIFQERGVLDAAWKLRLLARLAGTDASIKAGTYSVDPGIAPARLLRKLVAGEIVTVAVTVPEGLTLLEAADVLSRQVGVDRTRLLELTRHPPTAWGARLALPESSSLEGYLFPETYRFAPGVSADEVVETMLGEFAGVFGDSLRERASELGMSVHEVVTLASIVEAEATLPDERRRIAAVYTNRLHKGMRLEADPTVAYAVGVPGDRLTLAHLRVDSPYNTYRRAGLPPGPINSPGEACLRAVLWPQEGFGALFFVADGRGGHRFAGTWAEHRRNVRAYRRVQQQANQAPGR